MDRPVRRRRTTVLTVDAGPGHRVPARFYTLVVGDRTGEAVHAELLVPDGAELRPAHREPDLDQAA